MQKAVEAPTYHAIRKFYWMLGWALESWRLPEPGVSILGYWIMKPI